MCDPPLKLGAAPDAVRLDSAQVDFRKSTWGAKSEVAATLHSADFADRLPLAFGYHAAVVGDQGYYVS
jgi:hypothetical protein